MLSLSQLKSPKQKKHRRVGRGDGSGRGTYSGRGMKGQRSRSGGKNKLLRRGLKQMLQQLPKSRGFTSPYSSYEVVNIADLDAAYKDGAIITVGAMKKAGMIHRNIRGVKVLGTGKLTKKFTVHAHSFSRSAKDAITKAGGSVHIITIKKLAPHKAGSNKK